MCEKDGYKTLGWDGEDCPLLVMRDLTSFENREGWVEFRVLMNLQKCRDF